MSPQEFTQTVIPIKDKLFRFAHRIVQDAVEAEDIVQEVFIKLWRRREEMGQYKSLEAWCMTLTKNLCFDKLKVKHRKNVDLEQSFGLAAKTPSPEKRTELKDAVSRVRQILGDLPPMQAAAVRLRDMEGMSYQEISDALNMTMVMVRTNIFRGRQKIKEAMLKAESYGL